MKLGLMQPYFLPYIGYWQLMGSVDQYVFYDDVSYIKNGWVNRNRILVNGQPHFLTIPVHLASSYKNINETELMVNSQFGKLIKTVQMAYSKSPNFDAVFPIVDAILSNPDRNLGKFLEKSIRIVAEYLDIRPKFIVSSEFEKDASLHGEDRVLQICNTLGASEYINAIGGMELYNFDRFRERGVSLSFLRTGEISYKQGRGPFVPNLSILDVMMHNSKEDIRKFLSSYTLVSN